MPEMTQGSVIVIKQNIHHMETWRYPGSVLKQTENSILIEAFFNRPDTPFHGVLLAEGDRFIELYYNDRWYNIFEIHDSITNKIKAWYCNITYPAIIQNNQIVYVDLALDLLVYTDGSQIVLDEDEFLDLHLQEDDEKKAREVLVELMDLFKSPAGMILE